MIIVLRHNASEAQANELINYIEGCGLGTEKIVGDTRTVLAVIGNAARLSPELILNFEAVDCVKGISEAYSLAGRAAHPENSVFDIGSVSIGKDFVVIAGPCSIEGREQMLGIAKSVKASGAMILRGGAFKPRTSPYAFQGLGAEGLTLLSEAKSVTKLPTVSEILDPSTLPLFEDVDIIQVGARNMQNSVLLKALAKCGKPVLLKRGWSSTVKELLTSAEYLMSGGNDRVILCERGIRSFETSIRFTLDLSAVPVLKELSHLPVIVDPSHAVGHTSLVEPMALAAAAAGADGIMVEVHNDPPHALCDAAQAITPKQFDTLCKKLFAVRKAVASCDD